MAQSPKPILARQEQVRLLKEMFRVIRQRDAWVARGCEGVNIGQFRITFVYRSTYTGLRLENSVTNEYLLEFRTSRGGSARLVKLGQEKWLAHSGRVHRNHGTPTSKKKIDISGKPFFLVTKTNDPKLVRNLLAFHNSRRSRGISPVREPTGTLKQGSGIDAGSQKNHLRIGADVKPTHGHIVKALRSAVGAHGWKVSASSGLRPDLYVSKSGRKILFEIKPSRRLVETAAAIGQLTMYGAANKSDKRILVSYGLPQATGCDVKRVLDDCNITFLQVQKLSSRKFRFLQLDSVLNTNRRAQ
jgi:hypothetical protein